MLDWKSRLGTSLALPLYIAARMAQIKSDLIADGWPKGTIEAMSPGQVALLHISETYQQYRDDAFRWFHVPFPEAERGIAAAGERLKTEARSREIVPLASLLLPAVSQARFAIVRLDREIALLRCLSALRAYAAEHGKLPSRLADVQALPIPDDPVTGKPFQYSLAEDLAVLEGPPPPGRSAQDGGVRYEIRLAAPEAKRGAGQATAPGQTKGDRAPAKK